MPRDRLSVGHFQLQGGDDTLSLSDESIKKNLSAGQSQGTGNHVPKSDRRRRNSGFTLIELLIAVTIFSMVTGLVFFAFSQSISLWDRADKEIEKMDEIVFVNTWLKDLIHSVENLPFRIGNRDLPVFFGDKEKVLFLTSNPILNKHKVVSFAKIEFRERQLIYAEESLLKKDMTAFIPPTMDFDKEYPLLSDVEEGRLSYLVLEKGIWTLTDETDSIKNRIIPRAVKVEFLYKGKKVEILSYVLADAVKRVVVPRLDLI